MPHPGCIIHPEHLGNRSFNGHTLYNGVFCLKYRHHEKNLFFRGFRFRIIFAIIGIPF
jgi:hypothetical protein